MISIARVLKLFLLCSLLIIGCNRSKSERKETTQRPLILFDAFKEQVWSIKNTGFTGYSSLNLFLKNLGYYTKENHRPYKESLANLDPETLLVVGVAMEAEFTEDEIESILDFVGRGGKLLVIAEHDNQYGSADFLRPLINAAGWEIRNDSVMVEESGTFPGTEGKWIKSRLPSMDEGPDLLCAANLTPMREGDCKILLTSTDGEHIVAGLGNYKEGQIAIISDSEFLWNSNPDYKWEGLYPLAFSDTKTKAFIKDLIFMLLPPKEFSKSNDFSFSDRAQNSVKVFIYGNGGQFHNYSKFFTALTDENISVLKYEEGMKVSSEDRVIMITPLMKIPQQIIDELSKSEKIVIFGDMYTSVESYAETWALFFKRYKIYPLPYPANELAEKYGVSFLPVFGVNLDNNENGNILYIPVFFNGQQLYLHKTCAIKHLEQNEITRLSFGNSEGTFGCGAGFGLNRSVKSMDPNDMKYPDFIVVTGKVFAVGDSDIITDAFYDDAERAGFIDVIITFLKH